MAYIGKQPVVGNFQKCDAISVVNGQAAYTLNVGGSAVSPENANHMLVSLNGVLQAPGDSFTVSGSTLTFASNLATGDVIDFVIILGDVLDLGTPSDNSISTAKLVANSVTAAKFNADVISGQTALAETPADTDELLLSDAGVLKRIDFSHLKSTPHKTLLLTSTISSGTASVVINNTYITSTYRDYFLTLSNVHCSADAEGLNLHFSTNNGSSYTTGTVHRASLGIVADSASVVKDVSQAGDALRITGNKGLGNASGESANASLTLFNFLGTDNFKGIVGHTVSPDSSGNGYTYQVGGIHKDTTAVNAIKLQMTSGNFNAGVFKFYGIT